MGRSFGIASRFTLNYEFTFLALLGLSLSQEEPEFNREACFANPLRRKTCCTSCPQLGYACNVGFLMLCHKLRDNIHDDGFLKATACRMLLFLLKGKERRAAVAYSEADAALKEMMESQRILEERKCTSVDEACEPTAKVLSQICSGLSKDKFQIRVLEQMGYFLGRYVYMCDALDDLEEDMDKGSYNPFLLSAKNVSRDALSSIRQEAKGALYMNIAETVKAYELLPSHRYKPIIDNILCLGLRLEVDKLYRNDINESGKSDRINELRTS